MASTEKSTTPTPAKITLNLDTLEREQVRGVPKRKPDPYAVEFLGTALVFEDPLEIPAPVLMRMEETPETFFRAALNDEHFNHMMANFDRLNGWQLQALMQGYQDHYGLDGQGNARGSRR